MQIERSTFCLFFIGSSTKSQIEWGFVKSPVFHDFNEFKKHLCSIVLEFNFKPVSVAQSLIKTPHNVFLSLRKTPQQPSHTVN